MERTDDIFRFASDYGLRLTRVERSACVYLSGRDTHHTNLAQAIEDLEYVEREFGSDVPRSDTLPREALFDAVCEATKGMRREMRDARLFALAGILSWRWEGVEALRTTRTLIAQEIERTKGAAA